MRKLPSVKQLVIYEYGTNISNYTCKLEDFVLLL